MKVTESLAKEINVRQACAALAVPSASFYRWQSRQYSSPKESGLRPAPPLALSETEEMAILGILHEERFVDMAPSKSITNCSMKAFIYVR